MAAYDLLHKIQLSKILSIEEEEEEEEEERNCVVSNIASKG
jgi:hypothetical protein